MGDLYSVFVAYTVPEVCSSLPLWKTSFVILICCLFSGSSGDPVPVCGADQDPGPHSHLQHEDLHPDHLTGWVLWILHSTIYYGASQAGVQIPYYSNTGTVI